MRFRNSTRLLIENFKNVYKILLYKLAIAVVAIALSCALLLPNLWDIVHSAEVTNLIDIVKDFFRALVTGDSQFLAGFQEQFKTMGTALLKLLDSRMSKIVWSVVGCGVVYLLERFLDTLCYFSIGSILNDRMATYAETPFAAAYIKNLGKASIYSIVYVPVVFLFDVMTIGLCYFLFFYLLAFNVLASLFFSMTFIVLCQALKLTITSMWLPAMAADNMSIGQAMRFGDKQQKKQWKKVFSTYVATIYIIIIINVIGAVCTFGSALLLTVPASFMLFICEQFVNYYTVQGKRYFITYDRIAINRDRGDSEHFFETVEDPDDFSILPEGEYTVPFGVANVVREGSDLTIVATSTMVGHAVKVANELEKDGKSVEVIDPRTIVPLDMDTILKSVRKTGKLLIVDEGHESFGISGEIALRVQRDAFYDLEAPILRLGLADVPMPFSPALEFPLIPDPKSIKAAALKLL